VRDPRWWINDRPRHRRHKAGRFAGGQATDRAEALAGDQQLSQLPPSSSFMLNKDILHDRRARRSARGGVIEVGDRFSFIAEALQMGW